MITAEPVPTPTLEVRARPARLGPWALYLVLVTAVAVMAFLRPTYNWDLLGYLGATASLTETDAGTLHARVYHEARAAVPPAAYRALTQGTYRAGMAADPDHFMQQLPFYKVRPLFVSLVALVQNLGINPVRAVYLVSAGSYIALALLVFAWLAPHLAPRSALVLSFLTVISPPLIAVAHLGTADALSSALLVGALYTLLERTARRSFVFLLVLSVFARSDDAVFALILLLYLGFSPTRFRLPTPWFLGASGAVLLSYFAITAFAGNYGWATVFYHTFVHWLPAPAQTPVHITARVYLGALVHGLRSVTDSHLMVFTLLGVLAYRLAAAGRDDRSRLRAHILILLAATLGVRYLLFPLLLDRFLIPYYLLATVLLIVESAACAQRRADTLVPAYPRP